MQSLQPESRASSPARSLSRGQACVACRTRKVKCDGHRPVCGQCTRARRPQECHFESITRSRVQVLEESIRALEARIKELEEEGSNAGPSSIALHHPHVQPTASPSASDSPRSPSEYADFQSIPFHVSTALVDIFFRNTSFLPWFLQEDRVRQGLHLHDGDVGRPVTVLYTVMLLWGSIFHLKMSHEPLPLAAYPEPLLDQAMIEVGRGLVDASAQHIVQLIQAHVLLSVHLLDKCRFLESRAHTDAAASLAVHIGLHKIRGTPVQAPYGAFLDPATTVLPEPLDDVEEGERIAAFWTPFCLDRVHGVVLGVPPLIVDGDDADTQIDSPWPLDATMYEQRQIPPALQFSETLRTFLDGVRSGWPWETSALSRLSRASALFERATKLGASWRPDVANPTGFYARSIALNKILDDFLAQMPELGHGTAPQLYLAHNLAHAGKIQLHSVFAQQNPESRAKCLSAARSISNAAVTVQVQAFVFVDSSIGSIWAAACRVLIQEVVAVRNNVFAPALAGASNEAALTEDLDSLLAIMASLSAMSGAMNFHYSRIQQERLLLG